MRWVGYELWDVKRISLPSDVAQRMKQPHVIALAESTDDLGGEPMHAPSVNADETPAKLVAGRDRMAATLLRKRKKVWVHVGKDWTPADLLKAEIHENLHHRHDDKAALTKKLVDQAEDMVRAEADALDESEGVSGHATQNSVGRPKTDRAKAREIVAEASGETLNAVKLRDRRAQARESGAAGEPQAGAVAAPAAPLIEVFGHEIPEHVAAELPAIVGAFDKADKLLRAAQAAIGDLGMTSYSPGIVARLKAALHDVAAMVRGEKPTHLCTYCKGKSHPVKGPRCPGCQERGTLTKSAFEASPPEKKLLIVADEAHRGISKAGAKAIQDFDAGPKGKPRFIPPIKAGVTYTTDDDGNVVEQAKSKAAFDSPEWHRENAVLHGEPDAGKCGCKSCNFVRREQWLPEIDLSVKPKPRKGPRVVIVGADGTETEVTEVVREVARADGGA